MPRGFIGPPATAVLTRASTAHTHAVSRATSTNQRVASTAPGSANTANRLRSRPLPFEPSDGVSGTLVPVGRGNSSNIVISPAEYEATMWRVSQTYDRMGECLYNVANEIEAMCRSIFILPDTVPRCLNISDTLKRSLGQFRAVTDNTVVKARAFAREVADIGL